LQLLFRNLKIKKLFNFTIPAYEGNGINRRGSIHNFVIRNQLTGQDGHFKNTQSFARREKACPYSGVALLPEGGTMPALPSYGFFNAHPGP